MQNAKEENETRSSAFQYALILSGLFTTLHSRFSRFRLQVHASFIGFHACTPCRLKRSKKMDELPCEIFFAQHSTVHSETSVK